MYKLNCTLCWQSSGIQSQGQDGFWFFLFLWWWVWLVTGNDRFSLNIYVCLYPPYSQPCTYRVRVFLLSFSGHLDHYRLHREHWQLGSHCKKAQTRVFMTRQVLFPLFCDHNSFCCNPSAVEVHICRLLNLVFLLPFWVFRLENAILYYLGWIIWRNPFWHGDYHYTGGNHAYSGW